MAKYQLLFKILMLDSELTVLTLIKGKVSCPLWSAASYKKISQILKVLLLWLLGEFITRFSKYACTDQWAVMLTFHWLFALTRTFTINYAVSISTVLFNSFFKCYGIFVNRHCWKIQLMFLFLFLLLCFFLSDEKVYLKNSRNLKMSL